MSSIEVIEDKEAETLIHLNHLLSLYQLTTTITNQCFDTCLSSRLGTEMREGEKNCMANCAANWMQMKVMFGQRLVDAAKVSKAGNEDK